MDIELAETRGVISASFNDLAQPQQISPEGMVVAETPSQIMNGGRLPATPENAERIGMRVLRI